jgi:hypothetical protein
VVLTGFDWPETAGKHMHLRSGRHSSYITCTYMVTAKRVKYI